jgi:1,2-diacylglycerol 3-beta-glucosyltransferase
MLTGDSAELESSVSASVEDLTRSDGRRRKALLVLIACLGVGAAPHWLGPLRGLLPALTAAVLLGAYSITTLRSGRAPISAPTEPGAALDPLPAIDVLVAARDEEAVIGRLVEAIARLDYPADRLSLWVMDDGSEDRTPQILEELSSQHRFLNVRRRQRNAGGGKSGALNALLPQLQGDWLLVLDADADLNPQLLQRIQSHLRGSAWGAVQLRKAVLHADASWLTRSQALEMAFDAEMQRGRIAQGGIGELRGNGQLLRREVLLACGGFNEDTVTDDLDLSFRLLLGGYAVAVIWNPPVQEEPVTRWPALLRQRQRWAEGGLQRFLDYWPSLLSNRLTLRQQFDLLAFFLLQYALPIATLGDLMASLGLRQLPLLWPLSVSTLTLSAVALRRAGRQCSEGPPLPAPTPLNLLVANTYLIHWFLVIPWVTARMALRPKRLVWAKTVHAGLPVSS